MESWVADNLDTAREIAKTGLCDHCLGRMFGKLGTGMTNDLRGRMIRTALKEDGTEAPAGRR